MNKLLNIGLYIVIGALVSALGSQVWMKIKYKRDARDNLAKYHNCINAPIIIDTINDTIYIRGETIIKPIPIKEIIRDTVWVKEKRSWYDSTYTGDGLRFRWRAYTLGSLEELMFSDFVIPRQIIRERSVVDTCFDVPPMYRPKNHLGMDFNLSANRFNKLPNVDASVWFTFKDKWGVSAGGAYNTYHNEFYGKVGVKLFFK